MAFDEQDRFDHTETDNHVNEQNQTAGTAQNEGTEGSGLYRMTREDLKNSTLYTDTDRRSEYTSGTAYENRTNTAHTGSSYAAGNDYSYYHPTQNSGGNGGNGGNGGSSSSGTGKGTTDVSAAGLMKLQNLVNYYGTKSNPLVNTAIQNMLKNGTINEATYNAFLKTMK